MNRDFGFDLPLVERESITAWRDAAIADGWDHRPTYESESEDRAMTLRKDGFVVSVITRDPQSLRGQSRIKTQFHLSVWGPDGLAIAPSFPYDWSALVAGLRCCNYCHKNDVQTERVSFAGRCCKECLPQIRKTLEYPGWSN